jgi:hypothetical protein
MQKTQKKYHYIYKTTCLITKKFYIGMHSTDNLNDGYLGSGKILSYSIAKYGKANHVCEILEYLPNREALNDREKEIVNEDLLNHPLNINLVYGGSGGTHGKEAEVWARPGYKERVAISLSNAMKKRWLHIEYANKISLHRKILWTNDEYRNNMLVVLRSAFLGKQHTAKSKALIGEKNSISQLGSKNSQFGTCWITNGIKPIKIKKECLDEYLVKGYRLGRK